MAPRVSPHGQASRAFVHSFAVDKIRDVGKVVKCLIVRGHHWKSIVARVFPRKGTDEDNTVADMVLSDIEWLGCSRIAIKSDGEPAVRALAKRAV